MDSDFFILCAFVNENHCTFINEHHHNGEFILALIIIHVIFILLILSGLVRVITRAIFPVLIICFAGAALIYI